MAKAKKKHCVGATNPCHHTSLGAQAARMFGYTNYIEETGYVMPNGRMLDFSGRHEHQDYVYDEDRNIYVVRKPGMRDEQALERVSDHRQIVRLRGFKDKEDERGDPISPIFVFMVATGAARINQYAGAEFASIPTEAQARAIATGWRRAYPEAREVEVEMWIGPRQVIADSVERATAAKIISVAKKQFGKCRCVSGLEPCCHRKRKRKAA